MKPFVLFVWIVGGLFLLVAIIATLAEQRELMQIPLNQVWAHEMPGTRDVRELEPDVFGEGAIKLSRQQRARREKNSLLNRIGSLIPFARDSVVTRPGFAVSSTGLEALQNAEAKLAKDANPGRTFSTHENVSIFFFSYSFGAYVHLQHIERRGKLIEISYRFVPHETKQMTAHFAIIQLGTLPGGQYRVNMVRLPLEQKYVDQGWTPVDSKWDSWVVCQPFGFTVVGNG
jgi:hypothetical protein